MRVIVSRLATVLIRLVVLSVATEGLYLFLVHASRRPVEASLLAGWYRPVLFEETLEFLGAWALLFVLYTLAIRAASRSSGKVLLLFVFVSSAVFRGTLAAWGRFETVEASASFLGGLTPVSALLSAMPAALPPETVRVVAAVGLDLIALALAPGLLRAAGLPTGLALVPGWSPLLVKETAATPRVELALGFAALLLAIRLAQRSRSTVAALAYGVGLCGWPGLAASLPAMTRALRARVLAGLAVAATLWWVALPTGAPAADVLVWPALDRTGASLLPCLETLFSLFLSRDPAAPIFAAGAIWIAVALATTRSDPAKLPGAVLTAVGFLVFLAPQVMPWSFMPFAYLAAYSGNRGWLVFTATAPLTYLALGGGGWDFWLGFTQYFPAYASLTFVGLGGKKRRD